MIYLDNASTAFPKAPGVADFVKDFIDNNCFNVNRASYDGAVRAEEIVYDTREALAEFFGAEDSRYVTFCSGVTLALNMAIKGLVSAGDKVVTSVMEHNAVLRPLHSLGGQGVDTVFVPCDGGVLDLDEMLRQISKRPRAVVITHASNVCGAVNPITEIGKACRENGVLFIVDSAQSAGVIDIDMTRDNIDVLCFAGHKGLLALQGIGGMVFAASAAKAARTVVQGGTGSFSHLSEMPSLLPDKFEAGTLNLPGIASLKASLEFIKSKGVDVIRSGEEALRDLFEKEVRGIPGVNIAGCAAKRRCAVTSLDFANVDNGQAAYLLDSRYDIKTRSGLHCAPLAHKALGTFPRGTVRFSFGWANTADEVKAAAKAVREIASL